MTTRIVVHLLPQEIDWFEWQMKQIKIGSSYLESDDNLIIDATLNLNLVDWSKSDLPKNFFIEKFYLIETFLYNQNITCDFTVDEEFKCVGCDDKRRESIRKTKTDNIIYLDCDLIFKPELLKIMLDAAKEASKQSEYYIISPQITKLWDNSWDSLVNEKYVKNVASQDYTRKDPFELVNENYGDIAIKPIEGFKFGGGWFNLLSTNLLKLTDIPDSFGPYGVDDTYVMMCCNMMKHKTYNIQQYVLENMVVAENILFRQDPYKPFLSLINKQDEFRKQAEENLMVELQMFTNKI
jgi:hypothetical protein